MTTSGSPRQTPARGGAATLPDPRGTATNSPQAAVCAPDTPSDPDDRATLSYGLAEDGRLAHISEVVSGLDCRCRCAGCGGPLVARKGELKTHHFAHHVDRACVKAWETTLHRLAKEVVSDEREIQLPAAVAQVGEQRREIADATLFRYDAAEVEVDMDGVQPDAVVRRGDRELLLEFHVAHPCEPEKVAKLRERNLAAVEVDLSLVPRHASRAEHAELILRTAPRHWLHNARVAAEEANLREAERRRMERLHSRVADEVAAAREQPAHRGHASWREQARAARFSDFDFADWISGSVCFAVDAVTWQAAFLDHAVLKAAGQTFSADFALRYLQQFKMLKQPFLLRRNWPPELVAHVRERVPDFRPPLDFIDDYAAHLVARGVLTKTRTGWRADQRRVWRAQNGVRAHSAAQGRIAQLQQKLAPIAEALDDVVTLKVAAWLTQVLPDFKDCPANLARTGGPQWQDLVRRLDELTAMLRPGGPALPQGKLLGLPLEEHRLARQEEERVREENVRRAHEERMRRAAEQRRKESAAAVEGLIAEAEELLGRDVGRVWVEAAVSGAASAPFEEGRFALDWQARQNLKLSLHQEASRVAAAQEAERRRKEAEARADALAARCRKKLETEAWARFADENKTRLWLRGTQRSLGGSPWAHCRDEKTLEECLRLLDGVRLGIRRRLGA